MAAHAVTFGADIRQENVESIVRREDGIFEIATTSGTTYELGPPTVAAQHDMFRCDFLGARFPSRAN